MAKDPISLDSIPDIEQTSIEPTSGLEGAPKSESLSLDDIPGIQGTSLQENLTTTVRQGLTIPTRSGSGIDYSKYTPKTGGINPWEEDIDDIRAYNQSSGEKVVNGLAKMGITFTGAVAENTIGVAAGLTEMLSGGSYYDNYIGKAVDSMNEWAREELPNYYTNKEQAASLGENLATVNFWADKVANGLGYSLGSVATMFLTGGSGMIGTTARVAGLTRLAKTAKYVKDTKVISELARKSMNAGSVLNKTSKAAGTAKAGQALRYLDGTLTMSLAESSVEARETKHEFMSHALNKYMEEHGLKNLEEVSNEVIQEIEDQSTAAANVNFGMNMGIVGMTNYIQFGKMLGTGYREGRKNLMKHLVKDAKDGFRLAREGKVLKAGRKAYPYIAGSTAEAGQELGQFASNLGSQDYYMGKYFNSPESSGILDSMIKGGQKALGSKEGQESALIGFLVGGISHSVQNAANKFKDPVDQEREGAQQFADKVLNKDFFKEAVQSGEIKDKVDETVKHNNRAHKALQDMNVALEAGDEEAYRTAQFQSLYEMVRHADEVGGTELLKEKIKLAEELTDEEFKEQFGYDMNKPLPKSKEDIIKDVVEQIDTYTEVKRNAEAAFPLEEPAGLVKSLTNKEQLQKIKDYNHRAEIGREIIAYNAAAFNGMDERISKMSKELSELSKGLIDFEGNLDAEDYVEETKEQLDETIRQSANWSKRTKLTRNPRLKKLLKKVQEKASGVLGLSTKDLDTIIDDIQEQRKTESGRISPKFAKDFKKIVATIKQVDEESLLPDKVDKVVNLLNDLMSVNVRREQSIAAYNDLSLKGIDSRQINQAVFAEQLEAKKFEIELARGARNGEVYVNHTTGKGDRFVSSVFVSQEQVKKGPKTDIWSYENKVGEVEHKEVDYEEKVENWAGIAEGAPRPEGNKIWVHYKKEGKTVAQKPFETPFETVDTKTEFTNKEYRFREGDIEKLYDEEGTAQSFTVGDNREVTLENGSRLDIARTVAEEINYTRLKIQRSAAESVLEQVTLAHEGVSELTAMQHELSLLRDLTKRAYVNSKGEIKFKGSRTNKHKEIVKELKDEYGIEDIQDAVLNKIDILAPKVSQLALVEARTATRMKSLEHEISKLNADIDTVESTIRTLDQDTENVDSQFYPDLLSIEEVQADIDAKIDSFENKRQSILDNQNADMDQRLSELDGDIAKLERVTEDLHEKSEEKPRSKKLKAMLETAKIELGSLVRERDRLQYFKDNLDDAFKQLPVAPLAVLEQQLEILMATAGEMANPSSIEALQEKIGDLIAEEKLLDNLKDTQEYLEQRRDAISSELNEELKVKEKEEVSTEKADAETKGTLSKSNTFGEEPISTEEGIKADNVGRESAKPSLLKTQFHRLTGLHYMRDTERINSDPSQQRFFKFNELYDLEDFRIMFVTPDSHPEYFSLDEIETFESSDPQSANIRGVYTDANQQPVGLDGMPLEEAGHYNAIFSSLPSLEEYSFLGGVYSSSMKDRATLKEKYNDIDDISEEELIDIMQNFYDFRADAISRAISGAPKNVRISDQSNGIMNFNDTWRAPIDTFSAEILDEKGTEVWVANREEFEGKKVKKGLVYLKSRGNLFPLKNRNLNDIEASLVYDMLAAWAAGSKELIDPVSKKSYPIFYKSKKKGEGGLLEQLVYSTIDENNPLSFGVIYKKKKLILGDVVIPATKKGLSENKDVILSFLTQQKYHNILGTEKIRMDEAFSQVTNINPKSGEVRFQEWDSYAEYLLGSKSISRPTEDVPLLSNIERFDEKDTASNQLKSVYPIFDAAGATVSTPKAVQAKDMEFEKKPVKPVKKKGGLIPRTKKKEEEATKKKKGGLVPRRKSARDLDENDNGPFSLADFSTFEGDLGTTVTDYMKGINSEERAGLRELINTGRIKFKCE